MTVALVADLIFASRIEAAAAHVGAPLVVLRRGEDLLARLDQWRLVLVDLTALPDAENIVREVKQRRPALRVIGFFPHVQVQLKRAAQAAGADQVLTRSQFVDALPDLLAPPRPT